MQKIAQNVHKKSVYRKKVFWIRGMVNLLINITNMKVVPTAAMSDKQQ